MTWSKQISYFERGNKTAEKREFNKAIELYNLALSEKENARLLQLCFNKGVCLFHFGKLWSQLIH